MSEANQKTIKAYDDVAGTYVADAERVTPEAQRLWIDRVFRDIPKAASVLEIGSAFGREAAYLEEQGYSVDTSDASSEFVKYLRDHGFDARQLDIIEQKPDKIYDVILAFAVFVHFTAEDLDKAMDHIAQSLTPDGVLAFSVIQGDGDKWSDHRLDTSRFFKYWQQDELDDIAGRHELKLADSTSDNYGSKVWLQCIYRLQESIKERNYEV